MSRRAVRRRAGRTRRVLGLLGIAGAAAILLLGALLVTDGLRARGEATALLAELRAAGVLVRTAVTDDAPPTTGATLDETLARASAHAEALRRSLDGPHWSLAAHVPWAGRQVHALRELAGAAAGLVTDASGLIGPLVEAAPSSVTLEAGAFDASGLVAVRAEVAALDRLVQGAAARVREVDPDGLLGPLAATRTALLAELDPVSTVLDLVGAVADVLPATLAPDGTRHYLLLVQTEAEPRAGGGMVGAAAPLTISQGRITLGAVVPAGTVRAEQPVVALTAAEQALFGPLLASDLRDVVFTPDRARASELAAALWQDQTGQEVDGVVRVDPAVLAAVLRVVGPVTATTPSGTSFVLDAEGTEDVLLRRVYLEVPDPVEQDAVFAAAASAVLDRLLSQRVAPVALASALVGAAQEGRIGLWSAHEAEQERLAGSALGGRLAGGRDTAAGRAPVVGIRFNATAADKLGAYLEVRAEAVAVTCAADGSRLLEVDLTLTSTVPTGASLPSRVAGTGEQAGVVTTNVLLYAPEGGYVLGLSQDGEPRGMLAQVHDGLVVGGVTVAVPPGGSTVLRARLTTGTQAVAATELAVGPTAGPVVTRVRDDCGT